MFYWILHNLRDRSRRTVVGIAAGVMLLWIGLLQVTGLSEAIDRNARRLMYEVRGPRSQAARVIFVAIDERTVDTWGMPPWELSKLDVTLAKILAGGPKQIAVMEPGPRLLPGDFSPEVAQAIARGEILMPPSNPEFGQPGLSMSSRGVVENVALGSEAHLGGRTVTHGLLAKLGYETAAASLPVNFIGRQAELATLPAELVRRGEVPAATFAGRVVVIGMRGERFVSSVPTPVGPLSPAEIHAHLIHAVLERSVWRQAPGWMLVILCGALALLGYAALPRLRTLVLVGNAAVWAVAYVAAAYIGFAYYTILLPLGLPLGTLVFAAASGTLLERHRAEAQLARLVAAAIEHRSGERVWAVDELLERFYATSRMYLTFRSSHVTMLAAGKWHVELRGLGPSTLEEVIEQRRDIRREPYASAYATRRATWSSRPFVDPALGCKTMLIPLLAFHRLLGFWLIHVDKTAELSDADRRMAQLLAGQLALALEQGRIEQNLREARQVDASSDGYMPGAVAMLQHHSVAVFAQRAQQDRLVEHLPTGLLTASLWGDVVTVNVVMRRLLGMAGIERPDGMALGAILVRLLGVTDEAARVILRDIMAQGGFVRMSAEMPHATGPATTIEFTLSKVEGGEQEAGGVYVLSAAERREEALTGAQWQWSSGGDVAPRHMVDVLRVMQDVLRDWTGQGGGKMALDVTAAIAPVLGKGDKLRTALQHLVAEVGRASPGGAARVQVSEQGTEIVLRFEGPQMLLPASDISEIRGGGPVSEHLRPLREAREAVEACEGSLRVESNVEDGTVVEVHLNKRPAT